MKNGFTIIELIISVFILSVALVGIFSAFSAVTILTSDTTDRLTATYLAQEGMEIVRNIRDTNWLNMDAFCAANDYCSTITDPYTWLDGLNIAACSSGQGCEGDFTDTSMRAWSYGSEDYLKINPTNGFYVYNPSVPSHTKFKRLISILPIDDPNDLSSNHIVMVTVQVSWDEKANILYPSRYAGDCGGSNCITTEGTLYDWYNYVPPAPPSPP